MTPPFFLNHKSVQYILSKDNIGRSVIIDLIETNNIILSKVELEDFEKCDLCKWISNEHPHVFADYDASSYPFQNDIHEGCLNAGLIDRINKNATIKIIKSLACCENKNPTVIYTPSTLVCTLDRIATVAALAIAKADDLLDFWAAHLNAKHA